MSATATAQPFARLFSQAMEQWEHFPKMHASFPWRTATADQVSAHIASEPGAKQLNLYHATPLHFATSLGASHDVIQALLAAVPEWPGATTTWGTGPPHTKYPLSFGLVRQTQFDDWLPCSAEVAALLAIHCPESASNEEGELLEGAPTTGEVGAAVIAAAQAKVDALRARQRANADAIMARQLASLMARAEEVLPPAGYTNAGEVASAFVSLSGGGYEPAIALVTPECRTQQLLLALAGIVERMKSARETAKWVVVDDAEELQAGCASITVESQSTTGGGSMWQTTRQQLTLKIDVGATPPITEVVVQGVQ